MGGGVELPRGTKNLRVTLEGNGVPGIDGQGRGGDKNASATWDTEGNTTTSRREEMVIGQEPAAPPSAPQGMEEGGRRGRTLVIMKRHFNGAIPEHGKT